MCGNIYSYVWKFLLKQFIVRKVSLCCFLLEKILNKFMFMFIYVYLIYVYIIIYASLNLAALLSQRIYIKLCVALCSNMKKTFLIIVIACKRKFIHSSYFAALSFNISSLPKLKLMTYILKYYLTKRRFFATKPLHFKKFNFLMRKVDARLKATFYFRSKIIKITRVLR